MYKLNLEEADEPESTANILWIIEKAREFQKNIYFCLIHYVKPLTVWITTNWKILQEMGIPDHLTCLLRNLYADQEKQLELDMEQWTGWFQIGKAMGRLYIVTLLI